MPKVIPLGYYLVAFVDVVGRQFEPGQPQPSLDAAEDRRQVEGILRETSAHVRDIRAEFDLLYAEVSRRTAPPHPTAASRRPHGGPVAENHVWRMDFVGNCVMAIPFWKRRSGGAYGTDIYRCMAAMCGLFIRALLWHRPLRGAVDVGLGTEMDYGEVYGTANTRVMELERSAGYPRVMVGDGLLECLDALAKRRPSTREELHARSAVRDCLGLITTDPVDRASMLDPLGDGMRVLQLYSPEDIRRAHEYVASQAARFGEPCASGQTVPWDSEAEASRLRVYYARLLAYFEAGLPLWGLGPR